MRGALRIDAALWMEQRKAIEGPWPDVLIIADLRFWADPELCEGRARPSVRELAGVWGCSKSRAARLVADRAWWEVHGGRK